MEDVIEIPNKFRQCFEDETTEFAGMENPSTNQKEIGSLAFDCGETSTATSSIYTMSTIEPRKVKIQLAKAGKTMTSTHVGIKTYYVYDRTHFHKAGCLPLLRCQ